jgi:two-component system, NarL family, response regulator LiaR
LEQPIRIAIVEDHELTRMGLEAALQRRAGLEVIGDAANGCQGLNLLNSKKPDVAIVDIGLPDIDGIEVVRRFRENQGDTPSSTKILMLTMHNSQDAVMAAFAAGADAYCMKDINMDKLEEAIRSTHEGNPWIDPTIKTHVRHILNKLCVDDRTHAAVLALRAGLIE